MSDTSAGGGGGAGEILVSDVLSISTDDTLSISITNNITGTVQAVIGDTTLSPAAGGQGASAGNLNGNDGACGGGGGVRITSPFIEGEGGEATVTGGEDGTDGVRLIGQRAIGGVGGSFMDGVTLNLTGEDVTYCQGGTGGRVDAQGNFPDQIGTSYNTPGSGGAGGYRRSNNNYIVAGTNGQVGIVCVRWRTYDATMDEDDLLSLS